MPTVECQRTRPLGERGRNTRRALLDALDAHLAVTSWHRASTIAVARIAGVSGATFFSYFVGLEDAFVVLLAEARGRCVPPEPHLILIEQLIEHEAARELAANTGGNHGA